MLALLGAHGQLLGSVTALDLDERRHGGNGDDGGGVTASLAEAMFPRAGPQAALSLLSRCGEPPLAFYAGSEKMNPVPLFVLGKLHDGLVGGFMSTLVHT